MTKNDNFHEATVSAPVNIAVIKYWGKRDSSLILPTNSSLSVTLSQDHLSTRTTIRVSPSFTQDRLWLNGLEEDIGASKRLINSIMTARKLRKEFEDEQIREGKTDILPLSTWNLHVCSENDFPTAAGLASSASGYSALVSALAQVFSLPQSTSELSRVARVGSGSACRSMFGGFVAWEAGVLSNGDDSMAVQIADDKHWKDLQALILVVSDKKKTVSSTAGMQTTVETSELFKRRVDTVVPERMRLMTKAILEKNFEEFANITMKDSNQFHAVCLDTFPPISYMNDVSRSIANITHAFNKVKGRTAAAYTYDAGPNAVIYALEKDMKDLVQLFTYCFARPNELLSETFYPDPFGVLDGKVGQIPEDKHVAELAQTIGVFPEGSVRRIIHTKVGDGPRSLPESMSLLDDAGMPKRAKM